MRHACSGGLVLLIADLALLPVASLAQITAPQGIYEWSGQAGTPNWTDSGNWDSSNGSPTADADAEVFFAAQPAGPEEEVNVDAPQSLRSLWFDGSRFYTLSGDTLTLGNGLGDGGRLVTVTSQTGWGAETNINNALVLNDVIEGRTWLIENASEGGLHFGGTINLGSQNLLITGGQGTHFNGNLSGTGAITVTGPSGLLMATPTHLVLQGNNASTWSGALDIHSHAIGIVKSGTALGSGTTTVHSGGTLAWRGHADSYLFTTAVTQPILVEGSGVVRQDNTLPVGAIYNDGGFNSVYDKLKLTGDTWFGARGDISGSLWFYRQISDGGAGHAFIKVGPGLIALVEGWPPPGPEDRNSWGKTILRDGVLHIATASALPNANIELDGGVLEFVWSSFSRNLGTGSGEVQWTGDGGFSSSGSSSFSLNNGDALTWEQQYFVQDDHALLLGSRYSQGAGVIFTNDLNLGTSSTGSHREIRVAETARATLTGKISGTNANTGLLKTGAGLLFLDNDENSYLGPTIIRDGALRGTIHKSSTIVLDGGVLGLDEDFTRVRFSTNYQIIWQGSGGFAAYGSADRIVRIDNQTTSQLGWGWNNFVTHGAELRFGHSTANGTVIWDRVLHLGNQMRTIRVERGLNTGRADVVFNRELKTDGINIGLRLVGNGRADIAVANPNFKGSIHIFGAELRLHSAGSLAASPIKFLIRNGGMLVLDNTGTHNSDTGGSNHNNRIHDSSSITLEAGSLVHRGDESSTETLGKLTLLSGANEIKGISNMFNPGAFHFEKLERNGSSYATLDISDSMDITITEWLSTDPINDDGGIAIIPWAISSDAMNWLTLNPLEGAYSLIQVSQYDIGPETAWAEAHNVTVNYTSETLSGNHKINSLALSDSSLDLNGHTLTLNSGGLLGGWESSITGTSGSAIKTKSGRPLYIHNAGGDLTLSGDVAITGEMDVVKNKANALILGSSATHSIGSLYIHQGKVHLQNGSISISTTGEIVIGDGAAQAISGRLPGEASDILELPANRWNPLITPTPDVFPKLTLHGMPYDPRGPEYGGGQAILRMSGNTKQRLSELHIEQRGTIDWAGGEMGKANILWLDKLTFSGPDAILFMRNWYEYEDLLLVKAGGFDLSYLQNVRFEGYENFSVQWRRYDNDFYQITPFTRSDSPEPSTTGAILGTVGFALWMWKRRKTQQQKQKP